MKLTAFCYRFMQQLMSSVMPLRCVVQTRVEIERRTMMMKFILLAAAFTFAVSGSVLGQSAKQNDPLEHESPRQRVYVQYGDHKGLDRTHVDLMHMPVPFPDPRASKVEMFGGFTFPGKKPVPPEIISLVFVAHPSKPIFTDNPEVLILFDDDNSMVLKSHAEGLEHTKRYGEAYRNLEPYMDSDWLGIYIPVEAFIKIAKSKSVRVRNGATEFQLSEENLEGLRDLASRIAVSNEVAKE